MTRARYLLLDVDGVLNSWDWWQRRSDRDAKIDDGDERSRATRDAVHALLVCPALYELDPVAVARLNGLLARTGARVVVSSTWRLGRTHAELYALLRGQGVVADFAGTTPELRSRRRGHQIQAWMDATGVRDSQIAIVDDDSDMEHLAHRLVKTEFATGLLDCHVERLCAMLLEP